MIIAGEATQPRVRTGRATAVVLERAIESTIGAIVP